MNGRFRMYSAQTTNEPPRPNRIGFYLFNLAGGQGIRSYFQEPVTAGAWLHVVGTVDGEHTAIYKNGECKDRERYTGSGQVRVIPMRPRWIVPQRGNAPLRIGTRDLKSFFQGTIRAVHIWKRALTADEVSTLPTGPVLQGRSPNEKEKKP
jgi:hypothetical protein